MDKEQVFLVNFLLLLCFYDILLLLLFLCSALKTLYKHTLIHFGQLIMRDVTFFVQKSRTLLSVFHGITHSWVLSWMVIGFTQISN